MFRGRRKSIFNPMAVPRISARAVETDAPTALPRIILLFQGLKNFVAASDRQRPVTIPRWAALCWRIISIKVERVTTHRRLYPYWEPAATFAAQFPGSMNPTVTRNPGPRYRNSSKREDFG
jgi:hypothetical protein